MSAVIVTGGAGFLGSHLCERLLQDGHTVASVDNYVTGRTDNLDKLLYHPRFQEVKHDVIFPLSRDADEIYNLACPASPLHYQHDPIRTTKTSVYGTGNLLELASSNGARMLHASTSEVYGDPAVHPQSEDYWGNVNPTGRRACYDEGKRCAESLCFDYYRHRRLDVRVVRIFNTYGPRMHPEDGRVVSNFIVQALKGEPITVYGDGSQTRSFCYVTDLIDAMVKFMDTPPLDPGPLNLGNPYEVTIIELAEAVLRITRSRSRLVFKPLPEDDPKQRRPDISRAKSRLGWEPKVPLDEGLERTVVYFKTRLGTDARLWMGGERCGLL